MEINTEELRNKNTKLEIAEMYKSTQLELKGCREELVKAKKEANSLREYYYAADKNVDKLKKDIEAFKVERIADLKATRMYIEMANSGLTHREKGFIATDLAKLKAINSKKSAMSLSDLFCVERHKKSFLDLVKNKLDIIFANEQEVFSLINKNKIKDVVNFGKKLGKELVITRGAKGSLTISGNEVIEFPAKKGLSLIDLTGAGDLFAAGYLHGIINNCSKKNCLEIGTNLSSKIIEKLGARLNKDEL